MDYSGYGSLFSGVASLGNAYEQASAMKAQGDYQRRMGDVNAHLANLQAADALRRGNQAAGNQNSKVKQLIGTQRADVGGSGVDVNSGSAMALQNEARMNGSIDELTIRNNAVREAFGYKVNAINQQMSGQLQQSAANTNATSTLISGGLNALAYGFKAFSKPQNTNFLGDDDDAPKSPDLTLPALGSSAVNPPTQFSLMGDD